MFHGQVESSTAMNAFKKPMTVGQVWQIFHHVKTQIIVTGDEVLET